ncbi:2-isopropylmalate synthase [Paenibacillus senegalensis]|uniref:2-isopropylmalate synthase n=1 Tax=Paenibacillus senegalensis TaxID=1465766 RepID=UPI00028A1FE4|nr:2-isopropylmalate synthase [Paenibacillus senegalensis]
MNTNDKVQDSMFANPVSTRKIHIFDTTLRDGEQAPGASLNPEEKIIIARQLAKLGVDTIEPGFPISSPGEFTAVQTISRELQNVEICGFARAVKQDIDSALKATEDASRRRLHMFLSSSDIHLDFQLRKSRQQVVQLAREMIAYAKQFIERIEFSPMDATRTGMEFLYEVVEAVIEEGATIINIPDTVGYALPEEYGQLFRNVQQHVRGGKSVEYSAHCHNDLGLAVANSLAAVQAGATHVEVSVNGIGERAGNTSLEELVMAIETKGPALNVGTNIQLEQLYATSQLVSHIMHIPLAVNKPVVGRNAFQHEAGIHQDGLLKNRSTYEIMDPEQLGIPRHMIVLGKHSGRHAIKHRAMELGVALTEDQLEDVYTKFKQKADGQKTVTDAELIEMVGKTVDRAIDRYEITDFQVITGFKRSRVASVTVADRHSGTERTYSAIGEGPVEAVINGIKQAMPVEIKFENLELHSMGNEEKAFGEATVTIAAGASRYRGTGINQDVIQAVVEAFMAAANQAVRMLEKAQADKQKQHHAG